MVKALARAFRRRGMLDKGVHATIEDLAKAKEIAKTYVSQVLRLALPAPNIVEAILDGRHFGRAVTVGAAARRSA
jgi:ActR/RegA family two-component response regulator